MKSGFTGKLDQAAEDAIKRYRRLLHFKTLELLLCDMVREDGIEATQGVLEWYIKRLDEF